LVFETSLRLTLAAEVAVEEQREALAAQDKSI
jgi:hypothetical protein